MTDVPPPAWACPQWGQYEHDWLDCPECLDAYETYLEVAAVSEPQTATPKFATGHPVFLPTETAPGLRRGVVLGSHADGAEVHYVVLRRDGRKFRYAEADLLDADAVFDEAVLASPASTGEGLGKYGTLAAFAAKLHPGEPWFAIKAADRFGPSGVSQYANLLVAAGMRDGARDVALFAIRMQDWQERNPQKVKTPD